MRWCAFTTCAVKAVASLDEIEVLSFYKSGSLGTSLMNTAEHAWSFITTAEMRFGDAISQSQNIEETDDVHAMVHAIDLSNFVL